MVGGRQILTVKGDQQDDYFTVNPQVTFLRVFLEGILDFLLKL